MVCANRYSAQHAMFATGRHLCSPMGSPSAASKFFAVVEAPGADWPSLPLQWAPLPLPTLEWLTLFTGDDFHQHSVADSFGKDGVHKLVQCSERRVGD